MVKQKQKDSRFSKEHWIKKALEVLSQTGGAKIHIEKLAAKLGVTKGSFYWHFESRNDFVEQVLDYWEEKCTQVVIDYLNGQEHASGKALVNALIDYLHENDLLAYEMPVRSWAVQESRVQQRVVAVDTNRANFIQDKLVTAGMDADLAEKFSQQFICFCVCHGFMLPPLSKEQHKAQLHWLAETCL
jgi:AcrR family transcriptional regulator